MSLYRSEPMHLVRLVLPVDVAHAAISEVGVEGVFQFKDLCQNTSAFQRPYTNMIRRCDELLRQLRAVSSFCDKMGIEVADDLSESQTRQTLTIEALEHELERALHEVDSLMTQREKLVSVRTAYREHAAMLGSSGSLLQDLENIRVESSAPSNQGETAPLLSSSSLADPSGRSLGFIAGVVNSDKRSALERVLFRSTRGNVFIRSCSLPHMEGSGESGASMCDGIIVVFTGSVMQKRVKKVLDSFGVRTFDMPENFGERSELSSDLAEKLKDVNRIVKQSDDAAATTLGKFASNMRDYFDFVENELAVYAVMNMCRRDLSSQAMVAEGWCPSLYMGRLQSALTMSAARYGSDSAIPICQVIKTKGKPPTFFDTGKISEGFQSLISAYGTARYRELNPGVFSIVTFPFLFGVMFGDIGHGLLLVLVALYFIRNETSLGRQKLNEMLDMAFSSRYVLLGMGTFAMYAGLIYNETFGVALDMFGTGWKRQCPAKGDGVCAATPIGPYQFGVDPIWAHAENKLGYFNSLKMKMSIIIGIVQMMFGITLKMFNAFYFGTLRNFWFEAIPESLFLMSTFGYLVLLIFYKWSVDWVGLGLRAPSLLNTLINMFLHPGSPIPDSERLYAGQENVQLLLLLVAFIAVPWMLFPKPYLQKKDHESGYSSVPSADDGLDESLGGVSGGANSEDDEEEEFDFSEVMVHQVIHTIEFVLGAISNTASYLRLWALSLAHSQLSEVFLERVLLASLDTNAFGIVTGLAIWAVLTVGVLLLMESLSASLHDVRLHWIEFSNKFYSADGVAFAPLKLKYRPLVSEDV